MLTGRQHGKLARHLQHKLVSMSLVVTDSLLSAQQVHISSYQICIGEEHLCMFCRFGDKQTEGKKGERGEKEVVSAGRGGLKSKERTRGRKGITKR